MSNADSSDSRELRELVNEMRGMHTELQHLRDRQAIMDCLNRYTRAVDRHDWELIETIFHPDAIADHGMFVGSVKDLVKWLDSRYEPLYVSHAHVIGNHICDINGDTAHTETTAITYSHLKAAPRINIGGWRYVDRFERRNGEWKIILRRIVLDWRGQIDVLDDKPANPDHASPPGKWDRSDLAYMRPLQLPPERRKLFEGAKTKNE